MATVTSLHVGLQTGTDRTLYATWNWSYTTSGEERTDSYAVQWYYNTGDGVWFEGSNASVKIKQSTYNAPSNAKSVKVRVRPVSKTYTTGKGKNQKTVAFFTATWSSSVEYRFQPDYTPDKPSTPSANIEKYTLTARVDNYTDDKANVIRFNIVYDDTKTFKTLVHDLKTTSAEISVKVSAGHTYKVRCRAEKCRRTTTTKTVNKKKTKVTTYTLIRASEQENHSSYQSIK